MGLKNTDEIKNLWKYVVKKWTNIKIPKSHEIIIDN
jgi:hypothetical protein